MTKNSGPFADAVQSDAGEEGVHLARTPPDRLAAEWRTSPFSRTRVFIRHVGRYGMDGKGRILQGNAPGRAAGFVGSDAKT